MKIFISHASANKDYGDALVELLRAIDISQDHIIYTSNPAYGIPLSQNIFNWLKAQITENPFVIYLLSKEYYASIACLNEMGAAWIVENKHAIIFIPGFEISSKEFQNGAIDPREIGFYLDNQERLLSFIQLLEEHFQVSKNRVLIQQAVDKFINTVKGIRDNPKTVSKTAHVHNDTILEAMEAPQEQIDVVAAEAPKFEVLTSRPQVRVSAGSIYEKFVNDVVAGKLNEVELLLINYMIETGNVKLLTGWQERNQITKIELWEDVHEMNNRLSASYAMVLEKFGVRGYTEISDVTSYGNPKEMKLKQEIAEQILDLPEKVLAIVSKAAEENSRDSDNGLPF